MQEATINNETPVDVVSLEEAKKLSRLGWAKTQTKVGYKKRNNCSVYDKVLSNGRWSLDYDAPNADELKQMCNAVGKVGLSDDLSISDLMNELIGYCKRKKLKMSDYYIR